MSNPLLPKSPGDIRRQGLTLESAHAPQSPTQKLGTPQGGRWREVQSAPLINNVINGAAYTDLIARFQIDNPSARLHVKASIVYVPDTSDDAVFPTGGAGAWMWAMDAWDRTDDGRPGRANNIFTNRPAPSSYEAITATDQWRATVTVPASDAGIIKGGALYVIAAWEPAPGWNINEEQLARIFQACHLRVTHALMVSTGV